MAYIRIASEKALVSLEAEKLLGMKQVFKVSAERAGDAGRPASAAEVSRLLSKVGGETQRS